MRTNTKTFWILALCKNPEKEKIKVKILSSQNVPIAREEIQILSLCRKNHLS
jgi:hypothetical protein